MKELIHRDGMAINMSVVDACVTHARKRRAEWFARADVSAHMPRGPMLLI